MEQKNLQLSVVGISHKTSNIEEREPFQIPRKEFPNAMKSLISLDGVEGVILIATCNRVEFYLTCNNKVKPISVVKEYYRNRDISLDKSKRLFYTFRNNDVSRHLFRVISGLESLVVGEYQVQNQVKEAYSIACEIKCVDKILHKLLHAAFRTGKKVRTDTALGLGKTSVSGVATKILLENLNKNDVITIIGVNENTKICAEALSGAGFYNFIFSNRTLYKAAIMAEQYGGRASDLSQLEANLGQSDAVFSSTGADSFIICSGMLNRLAAYGRSPRLIIDMAIPRDIDTAGLPDYITKYDISSLRDYLATQSEGKVPAIVDAEKIIEEEVSLFQAWSDTQTNDILAPYAEKFELIRQQVLEESRNQFNPQSYEAADRMTRFMLHRLQSDFVRILLKQKEG